MSARERYIIGGGTPGRERLRVLNSASATGTRALLDAVTVAPGWRCLDAGCGGGDVTLELAARVGPQGSVLGLDIDEEKLALAREEARECGAANVEYRAADVTRARLEPEYDLVHARFLLTHMTDPAAICRRLAAALVPGGVLALSDVDFRGLASEPPSPAYARFAELYVAASRARGCDPYIAPRLPGLLEAAGLERIGVMANQPAGRGLTGVEADVKRVPALSMALIADAVVDEGLAPRDEAERLVAELRELALDPSTTVLLPRTVAAWGYTPPVTRAPGV